MNERPAGTEIPRFASVEEIIARTKPVEPVYVLYPEKFRDRGQAFSRFLSGRCALRGQGQSGAAGAGSGVGRGHPPFRHRLAAAKSRSSSRAFPMRIAISWRRCALPGAAKAAFGKYGVTDYVVDCDFELDKLLAETGRREEAAHLRARRDAAGRRGAGAFQQVRHAAGRSGQAAEARGRQRRAARHHLPCRLAMPVAIFLCPGDRDGAAHRGAGGCGDRGARYRRRLSRPLYGNDVPPYHWYFDTIREALDTLPKQVPVMCEPGRALIAEGMSLITQVVLRKGDRLYINDGTYGSFDELTLPGWTADYPDRAFTVDKRGRVTRSAPAGTQALPRLWADLRHAGRAAAPDHAAGNDQGRRFHRLRRHRRLFGGRAHQLQRLLSRTTGRSWAISLARMGDTGGATESLTFWVFDGGRGTLPMSDARQRLTHLLDLAGRDTPEDRRRLVDELCALLLDWPEDYPLSMRAPFRPAAGKGGRGCRCRDARARWPRALPPSPMRRSGFSTGCSSMRPTR